MTILALIRRTHLSAEGMNHELQPVANAEHRHSQLENALIGGRRILVINGPGRS